MPFLKQVTQRVGIRTILFFLARVMRCLRVVGSHSDRAKAGIFASGVNSGVGKYYISFRVVVVPNL